MVKDLTQRKANASWVTRDRLGTRKVLLLIKANANFSNGLG